MDSTLMEKQMEKKLEPEMETGMTQRLLHLPSATCTYGSQAFSLEVWHKAISWMMTST